jgi:hypothetical protein
MNVAVLFTLSASPALLLGLGLGTVANAVEAELSVDLTESVEILANRADETTEDSFLDAQTVGERDEVIAVEESTEGDETLEPDPVNPETQPSSLPPADTAATDLRVGGRFTVGHSSSSAGTDGFTNLGGFIPLWQTPGQNVIFLEGGLRLDNGGHLGGNAVLGYRQHLGEQDRTLGGYVAFDNRNTGQASFNQLGFGVETLSETWDLRLNGYVPVGHSRQLIDSQGSTPEMVGSTPRFEGNSLFFDPVLQNQVANTYQTALGGFDIEAGGRLLQFANGGDLRAYVSPYYLNGPGIDSTFGIRGRLAVQPRPGIKLGVGAQYDEVFGSHLFGSVQLSLPGGSGFRGRTPAEQRVARLAAPMERIPTVRVDVQQELLVNQFVEGQPILGLNPETGAPWVFIHVADNGNSDGSIESPFGNLADAIAVAQSDGNQIIYVRTGNTPYQGNVTIPDNVQLWSTGLVQTINTQMGTVTLPESGTGVLPVVLGDLTPGAGSEVWGFVELSWLGNIAFLGDVPATSADLANAQILITNGPGSTSLATGAYRDFLDLELLDLATLVPFSVPTRGSAVQLRVTAPMDSTPSLTWNFLTNEHNRRYGLFQALLDPARNDYGFITVGGSAFLEALADVNAVASNPSTAGLGFTWDTGLHLFDGFEASYGNGFVVGLGVVDVNQRLLRPELNSGLFINGITLPISTTPLTGTADGVK